MNIEKMIAIVRKETEEIFYSKNEARMLYLGLIVPAIILPILAVYSIPIINGIFNLDIEKEPVHILQYFIDRIYPWFFLIGNISMSITVITDSLIGEKERKTIERVLSTPVDEMTLLLGKSIASLLYTYVPTVASFCLLILFSNIFSKMMYDSYIWPSIKVIFILIILSPIITMTLIGMGIITSIKSRTVREANSLSGFISFIIIFPSIYGFMKDPTLIELLIISLFVGIICVVIFLFACKLFKREELIRYV